MIEAIGLLFLLVLSLYVICYSHENALRSSIENLENKLKILTEASLAVGDIIYDGKKEAVITRVYVNDGGFYSGPEIMYDSVCVETGEELEISEEIIKKWYEVK